MYTNHTDITERISMLLASYLVDLEVRRKLIMSALI